MNTPDGQYYPGAEATRHRLLGPLGQEEVFYATLDVLSQAWPHLVSYDVMVGDYQSGELPAFLFHDLGSLARRAVGLRPPQLRFMRGRSTSEPPKRFVPHPRTQDSRLLIVTELIRSGKNMQNVYTAASVFRSPASIDIAAISSIKDGLDFTDDASRFFYSPGNAGQGLYSGKAFTGHVPYEKKFFAAKDIKLNDPLSIAGRASAARLARFAFAALTP